MVHLNMVFRCPLVLMVIALVSLVGCGSGETEAVQPQQEISDAQARALYTRKCSLCHGNERIGIPLGITEYYNSRGGI